MNQPINQRSAPAHQLQLDHDWCSTTVTAMWEVQSHILQFRSKPNTSKHICKLCVESLSCLQYSPQNHRVHQVAACVSQTQIWPTQDHNSYILSRLDFEHLQSEKSTIIHLASSKNAISILSAPSRSLELHEFRLGVKLLLDCFHGHGRPDSSSHLPTSQSTAHGRAAPSNPGEGLGVWLNPCSAGSASLQEEAAHQGHSGTSSPAASTAAHGHGVGIRSMRQGQISKRPVRTKPKRKKTWCKYGKSMRPLH